MSLDLEELGKEVGKEVAVQAAGVAIGKVIDSFVTDHPAAASKIQLGKDVLQRGLALFSDEELAAYLTSDDAAAAEIAYRLARIAKFGK